MMIDQQGLEWLSVPDAADRFAIRRSLIYGWVKRGVVEAHVSGLMMVSAVDVAEAEYAWRTRAKGHRRAAPTQVLARVGFGE